MTVLGHSGDLSYRKLVPLTGRRLNPMRMTIKQGALALTVLSSAALFAGPAVANSIHDEGDFGGGYRPLLSLADHLG